MKTVLDETFWVKIYIAGPINVIEQTCRKMCLDIGLCVTVEPTKFIYTGGEETGAIVGMINYPRFPKLSIDILETADKLAEQLLEDTYQHSVLIMDPDKTKWITKREQ